MSGISSGVGLLSGLPTQSIIDQLIQLESRPLLLLQERVDRVQIQRTAYAALSARLLGLKSTVARFDEPAFFRASAAQSSDDSVLTATAGEDAAQGTFQFQVRSLVTNNQLISGGFVDTDRQPVGVGSLSLEIGNGRLSRPTSLAMLNGGEGVRRGVIEITDSSGDRESIDLATSLTVQDIVDEINANTQISVRARVDGDHLVIEDEAGGTGTLNVRDLSGGHMAEDLGIAGTGTGVITGSSIIFLSDQTQLSVLNDGNGVSVGALGQDIEIVSGGNTFTVSLRGLLQHTTHLDVLNNGNGVRTGTFQITNRSGESAEITIDDSVQTIGDVIDAIESAGIDISVTTGAVKGQLVITDDSTPADEAAAVNFKIEDVTGQAASDLGLIVDTEETTVTGSEIHRISTLGDVLRAINFAVDASDSSNVVRNEDIVAAIGSGGRGITLTSISGATGPGFSVSSGEEGSGAAEQLGLITAVNQTPSQHVGRDVLADLNSVLLSSLNGGRGVSLGDVKFTDADGNVVRIHFSATGTESEPLEPPRTVQAFIARINEETAADGVAITARLNDAGNGILFEDTSGGSGTMSVNDFASAGTTVRDLFGSGFVQSTDGELDTGNTQLQYVSLATSLNDLNFGRGIGQGSFKITAGSGAAVSVNLGENQRTVGDVIKLINATGSDSGIEARINDRGDGIEIIDRSGGLGALKIEDENGGTAARDMNIAGEGVSFEDDGETHQRVDGSYEFRVDIDADDTLDDVKQKIADLGLDVDVAIINDGGASNPFHLIVTSGVTGTRGEIVFDAGDTNLAFDTLVRAQDAVVFFGGAGAENPIVLTSSSNTLSGVLGNVTIDLAGTSDTPVELSITRDLERIVTDLGTFVSSYNGVLADIDDQTSFDAETNARGALFGESTVNIVQSRLRSSITRSVPGAQPGLDRLIQVGVSVGSGGRLSFDEERFREVYASDPEAIEALFTTEDTGLGDRLDTMLDDLTRSFDGLLTRRDDLLTGREELFNDRMDTLEEQLTRKRSRLERQFQGLESALANLQGAQSAVGTLSGLAAGAFG